MQKRAKKQIIFGVIYLVILAGIGTLLYFIFSNGSDNGTPPPPPPAKDIEIIWAKSAPQTPGLCDLVAKIKNPNPHYFLRQMDYEFLIYEYEQYAPGTKLFNQEQGTSWLLPNQEKYLVANEINCPEKIARVIFKVDKVNWQQVKKYQEPRIQIFQKSYQELDQGPPYAQVSAVIVNKNDFNLQDILINVILLDSSANLISARQTKIDNLAPKQEQKITYHWLTEIKKDVFNLILEPDIKISDVFLR